MPALRLRPLAAAVAGMALLAATPVPAIDRDTQNELRRLEQIINRRNERADQLMGDIRALQKENEKLRRQMELMDKKVNESTDDVTAMKNTDVANLTAIDKQILARLDELNKLIADQTPTWNWGTQTRDCKDLGTHQQIQNVKSGDGKFTLRYLCFDGRPIHLGTEVNLPPK
jgi:TolA-binding protein